MTCSDSIIISLVKRSKRGWTHCLAFAGLD